MHLSMTYELCWHFCITYVHTCVHTHTVPSAPPFNVQAQALTSSSIQVTWDEVPVRQQHGTITNYEVEYKQETYSSVDNVQSMSVTSPTLMVNLTLLHEYTEYFIRVRAYTSVGPGPYSIEISATTLEDSEYNMYISGAHESFRTMYVLIHMHFG